MQNIGLMRLAAQHVAGNKIASVAGLVSWMGAMQAQDLNSVKWAIGVRLPGSAEDMVDDAINKGEIVRTHLMRPTWHFVSANDYPVILELTASNVKATLKSRRKQLELDEEYFKKSNPAIQRVLANQNHLTREELMSELSITLPQLDGSRMNHVLLEAELDGLICSGVVKKKQHSFALRSERFNDDGNSNKTSTLSRDEALYMLALKYFSSHGPATISDFNWWSGLSMTHCRKALEMVKGKLLSDNEGTQEYWFAEVSIAGIDNVSTLADIMPGAPSGLHHENMNKNATNTSITGSSNSVQLLPAFDEFIISYKDRSAVLKYEDHSRTVSDNGIFRPVIVLDGQVIGLWNKIIKKDKLSLNTTWFITPDKTIKHQVQIAAVAYARFLGLSIDLKS